MSLRGQGLEVIRAEDKIHSCLDCLDQNCEVVRDTDRTSHKMRQMVTVEGDEADMLKQRREWVADIIAEPEMRRFPAVAFRPVLASTASNQLGTGGVFWTVLRCHGAPVVQASISVVFLGRSGSGAKATISAVTEVEGTASVSMPNPQLAPDRFSGSVFLASFSNFGPAVRAAGPGVAIISTVPTLHSGAPSAAMSGTSMAAPMACAGLAASLSEDTVYRQIPRGPQRTLRVWQVLTQNLRNLPGLAPVYVGGGLASASN